ncbi:MAG: universal stress protein [Chloroflexi bacterium]|nr:universal stress protein [Chloroflexota bacterium]
MYSKILIPLDGSAGAELVLDTVKTLTNGNTCELVLLRVLEKSESKRKAETYLKEKAEEIDAKKFSVTWRTGQGAASQVILAQADALDAGLVAMTSHGRGDRRAIYGRVARGVLDHAQKPLLMRRLVSGARVMPDLRLTDLEAMERNGTEEKPVLSAG